MALNQKLSAKQLGDVFDAKTKKKQRKTSAGTGTAPKQLTPLQAVPEQTKSDATSKTSAQGKEHSQKYSTKLHPDTIMMIEKRRWELFQQGIKMERWQIVDKVLAAGLHDTSLVDSLGQETN
jgi:hypothetical protein